MNQLDGAVESAAKQIVARRHGSFITSACIPVDGGMNDWN